MRKYPLAYDEWDRKRIEGDDNTILLIIITVMIAVGIGGIMHLII